MIYRNVTNGENLWWSFGESESYQVLDEDLSKLRSQCKDKLPVGAVSDWKGCIVNAVSYWFGPIPHQRCLSHVVRDIKALLPKSSPIQATLELRAIGISICGVASQDQLEAFRQLLLCWEVFYGEVLIHKSYPEHPETTKRKWWYTHGNIRRAHRILTKNQTCLFEYLTHQLIPATNNSLEGVNSDIKTKLAAHRGMKPHLQYAYLCWYFTFQKVKTPVDLKKLWDYWKKKQ